MNSQLILDELLSVFNSTNNISPESLITDIEDLEDSISNKIDEWKKNYFFKTPDSNQLIRMITRSTDYRSSLLNILSKNDSKSFPEFLSKFMVLSDEFDSSITDEVDPNDNIHDKLFLFTSEKCNIIVREFSDFGTSFQELYISLK